MLPVVSILPLAETVAVVIVVALITLPATLPLAVKLAPTTSPVAVMLFTLPRSPVYAGK